MLKETFRGSHVPEIELRIGAESRRTNLAPVIGENGKIERNVWKGETVSFDIVNPKGKRCFFTVWNDKDEQLGRVCVDLVQIVNSSFAERVFPLEPPIATQILHSDETGARNDNST